MKNPDTIKVLMHKLNILLDDPHPGLMTWNEACLNTMRSLRRALTEEIEYPDEGKGQEGQPKMHT